MEKQPEKADAAMRQSAFAVQTDPDPDLDSSNNLNAIALNTP